MATQVINAETPRPIGEKYCHRCKKAPRPIGEKYCGKCRRMEIHRMEASGYLQRVPAPTRKGPTTMPLHWGWTPLAVKPPLSGRRRW